jgi:hypothetical protein
MLGNAVTRMHKHAGGLGEPEEALEYFSMSMRELSKQLADPIPSRRIGEDVVGAIVGLACQNVVFGNFGQGKVHMDALKQIITIRGGIETLESNYPLALFIYWVDVVGAMSWDQPPNWPAPWHIIRPTCQLPCIATPSVERDKILAAWRQICPDDDLVRLTLESLARLSEWMDIEYPKLGADLWKDQMHYSSNFLSIAWTILSLPRIRRATESTAITKQVSPFESSHFPSREASSGAVSTISETMRLAALTYLYLINRIFDIPPDQAVPHSEAIFSLLRQPVAWNGSLGVLHLWCLVMSALAQPKSGVREWHRVEIKAQMGELGLENRQGLLKTLRQVSWVDDRLEERLELVYDD